VKQNYSRGLLLLFCVCAIAPYAFALDEVPPLLDKEAMNTKVAACENFYEFACGNWIKNFKILDHKAMTWRQSEAIVNNQIEEQNNLLEGKHPEIQYPYKDKVETIYKSCMNEAEVEKHSLPILKKYRALINGIHDSKSLSGVLGELHMISSMSFFNTYAAEDYVDASKMVLQVDKAGFSLPEKSYYTNNDKEGIRTREEFLKYIQRLFELSGDSSSVAKGKAKVVLEMETRLAESSLALAEENDEQNLYHPLSMKEFTAKYNSIDWPEYFSKLGVNVKKLNLRQPKFLERVNEIVHSTPLETIKIYMTYVLIDSRVRFLSPKFEKEAFLFWDKFFEGRKSLRERWMRCTDFAGENLREAIGQGYVAMNPDAAKIKKKATQMFETIVAAFSRNLQKLTWLDSKTKKAAEEKLQTIIKNIAYPEHWKKYDSLTVLPDTLLQNALNISVFKNKLNYSKLGKKSDRKEWDTNVWEWNAFFDTSKNAIVYPLGNLIPPVMDLNFSDAANYGSEYTMAHELTHGFDSSGSKFDKFGNLKNWWSGKIYKEFDKRAQCLVHHASNYKMSTTDLKINGEAVIAENIADLGGVKFAYQAMKNSKPVHKVWYGYNEEQQFFIAYAQAWCSKRRPESLRNQMLSDVHSPEEYRVNGILANTAEFAQAFNCKEGQALAPKERCTIW
jgi:putative endopeptidase